MLSPCDDPQAMEQDGGGALGVAARGGGGGTQVKTISLGCVRRASWISLHVWVQMVW